MLGNVACHNRESCQATQTIQRAENAPILLVQNIPQSKASKSPGQCPLILPERKKKISAQAANPTARRSKAVGRSRSPRTLSMRLVGFGLRGNCSINGDGATEINSA